MNDPPQVNRPYSQQLINQSNSIGNNGNMSYPTQNTNNAWNLVPPPMNIVPNSGSINSMMFPRLPGFAPNCPPPFLPGQMPPTAFGHR